MSVRVGPGYFLRASQVDRKGNVAAEVLKGPATQDILRGRAAGVVTGSPISCSGLWECSVLRDNILGTPLGPGHPLLSLFEQGLPQSDTEERRGFPPSAGPSEL